MLTFAMAASFSTFPCSLAQSFKPSDTIDLKKVEVTGSTCKVKLPSFSSIEWLDDSRLLASTSRARCDDDISANPNKFETIAVLFDIRGVVLATNHSRDTFYTKGPHRTVAAHQPGEINLLDSQMHGGQAIPCPNASKVCWISVDKSSTSDFAFALCTSAVQIQQVCDFYTGWPATKLRQETFPVREDPFTRLARNTWQVSPNEKWVFKGGYLISVAEDESQSFVNPTNFLGDHLGSCDGQLSEALPRRFLATCTGTHWYSDGMFDAIFGFSRTVLFDVSTKSVIGRFNENEFISAVLSPSGRKIAILKGEKIRLYDVP